MNKESHPHCSYPIVTRRMFLLLIDVIMIPQNAHARCCRIDQKLTSVFTCTCNTEKYQIVSGHVTFLIILNLNWYFVPQNPEEGGSGPKKLSFRSISARLRGEDTSYQAQLAVSEKELEEAETTVLKAQKEFE